MSGQSVLDRMNAARHTITGSDLAKSVYKATTEEVLGPKKKHLDYLLQCTNTEHINIPELADMIIERSTNANWVVAFKTLVTCHHLMVYGNERFLRYLATRTTIFNLEEFTDKGGAQGYEMSIFVRKYSKYLNQKAYSYRNMAFDFCRAKRGKEDGVLRTMTTDKLLKALPHLQSHLDALLDFEVNSAILSNGVINSAFLLLFKDCIRLFACYNDGIINLLDKFFEMPKKECKIALDLYKKFLIRMEKVAEFLKVAEQVGVDKGEIPDLAKFGDAPDEFKNAPSSLLEALENHLASLEGKVKANWTKPQVAQQAVNAFTSSLAASDVEKERAIEEEKERLAALKIQTANTYNTTDQARLKEIVGSSPTHQPAAHAAPPQPVQPPATSTPAPNPFTSPQPVQAVPVQAAPSADLFSAAPAPEQSQPQSSSANDLIGLNTSPGMNAVLQAQRAQSQQSSWGATNGFPNNNTIGADFQSAFGTPVSGIQEPAILPQNAFMQSAAPMSAGPPMGEILQPMNKNPPPAQSNNVATASISDLDSTLSSLATNLDIKGGPSPKKTDHQWSKSTNSNVRTGGQTWQPKQVASTTTWPQQPMPGQYMDQSSAPPQPNVGGQPADWRANAFSGHFVRNQPLGMNMGMNAGMNMGMQPGMAPMGMAGGYGQPMMGQPMGYPYQRPPQQQTQQSDPFGPY
ncbi:Phosphatidylinositol-binding clathrin assembly protein [Holothuria leucospilota]|uniref:Phosphatidylinositol-binding clathrin assembly protein n=1 Tax=Holothuria leucospilota TaxID=206669 RepID=A0A9Q0YPX9_HOLLE|nr:Phosphatidylinositol-binding clathrin assembly protein [Holothuria leucospilota]